MRKNQGFTLIEIAVVLAIIGLMAGAVMGGREMINSAKLKSVIVEIDTYSNAITTFNMKYGAMPGDMPDATNYWDTVSGDCYTVSGSQTQTCNGDGDGIIDSPISGIDDTRYESWRAWQHLGNSGILPTAYSGISATGCSVADWCTDPGVNAPISKYGSGASWHVFHVSRGSSWFWQGKSEERHILILGNPNMATPEASGGGGTSNGVWHGIALTPQDMASIEAKIDDGMPNNGTITNMNGGQGTIVGWTNPDCTTGSGVNLAYNLAVDTVACTLFADIK